METSIARKHIEAGRRYPRPRAPCDCCGNEVILCWGEIKTTPHWRHPSGKAKDGHQASCESGTHKFAKELMIKYLTRGGICIYKHACDAGSLKKSDDACVKFVEEYTDRDIRWDIACLSEDNRVLFGIEIKVTHSVNKTTTRNEVPWVEVDAYEVISHLDFLEVPGTITLNNISTSELCCIRKFELKRMSHLDIARSLGFLVRSRGFDAQQRKYVMSDLWCERGEKDKYQSEVAEEFLSREKCLKCERKYDIESCFKPYCGRCYYLISNDDIHEDEEFSVDSADLSDSAKEFKKNWV